mmetsp:Transcript_335/g.954  ORF Transcript_335/g.954 Transcript_335/m.954 type:complete len:234 (-) Transcript_335:676-1377(-)
MGRPIARAQRQWSGCKAHHLVVLFQPLIGPSLRRVQDMARVIRQRAGIKRRLLSGVQKRAAHHIQRRAIMGHLFLGRGPQSGQCQRLGFGPCKTRPVARIAGQRLHDGGQAAMLAVMQMVGLGCRKEDFFHPLAPDQLRQKPVPTGLKRRQDIGHRTAHVLHRRRAGMNRAKRIHQHNLTVNSGKVITKKRAHDLRLVGLIAARHFAAQRPAGRITRRQRRKGQHRRTGQITW